MACCTLSAGDHRRSPRWHERSSVNAGHWTGSYTCGVSDREETNVRIPQCAWDALAVIETVRGVSRDEAVRQVLDEHVDLQEKRGPDDRCTHISTVLRYPPSPRHRKEPRSGRVLRLRLAPGMAERARAVSLRLPGQARRAHHDYQARLLTDAVVTAIAVQERFTDEFLDGLVPVLRHREAIGLWQLAVAVTSTASENVIRDAAEHARSEIAFTTNVSKEEAAARKRRLLLVAEALDEEVAWHDPVRFAVTTNIARARLRDGGENAEEFRRLLYAQHSEWDELRQDVSIHGAG